MHQCLFPLATLSSLSTTSYLWAAIRAEVGRNEVSDDDIDIKPYFYPSFYCISPSSETHAFSLPLVNITTTLSIASAASRVS